MKKQLLIISFFIGISSTIQAQKIRGQIIDSLTLVPIKFASIMTDKNDGTISNLEGKYSLKVKGVKKLYFSCLGYKKKVLTLREARKKNFIIRMSQKTTELDEIHITSQKVSADVLIQRVRQHLPENYLFKDIKHTLYLRESYSLAPKNIRFKLKKSSSMNKKQFKKAKSKLIAFSNKIKSNTSTQFIDYSGDYHVGETFVKKIKKNISLTKLTNVQASVIQEEENDFTIGGITEKAKNMLIESLDTTITYKVKSGFFKVEDSLSFKEINKKSIEDMNTFNVYSLKSKATDLFENTKFTQKNLLNSLTNSKFYKYQIASKTYINEDPVYVVSFLPRKSKAKFSGTLFINSIDNSIVKVIYTYAKGKRGKHLNLKFFLGVKYEESLRKGIIVFQKNDNEIYHPIYCQEKKGTYFYVNRDFKFLENTGNREKTKFNVKLEGSFYKTTEMLISKSEKIDTKDILQIKEKKKIPYTVKKVNNIPSWKAQNILFDNSNRKLKESN